MSTCAPPPAEGVAEAPKPPDNAPAAPALPLEYENAWPDLVAPSSAAVLLFWRSVRRVVQAGGAGLVAWGLATLVASDKPYTAAFALGWGAFFLVLMLPMRRRTSRRKRRRRRRGVDAARRCGI